MKSRITKGLLLAVLAMTLTAGVANATPPAKQQSTGYTFWQWVTIIGHAFMMGGM